jgi:hypothetical protein
LVGGSSLIAFQHQGIEGALIEGFLQTGHISSSALPSRVVAKFPGNTPVEAIFAAYTIKKAATASLAKHIAQS